MQSTREDPVGRVQAIDAAEESALVTIRAAAICSRCAAGKGCGAGLLGASSKDRQLAVPIPAGVRLKVGDEVRLSLGPRQLWRATLTGYGLPLGGIVFGALLASQLGLGELGAMLSVVVGLAIAWVLARRWLRADRCIDAFTPVIASLRENPAEEIGQH